MNTYPRLTCFKYEIALNCVSPMRIVVDYRGDRPVAPTDVGRSCCERGMGMGWWLLGRDGGWDCVGGVRGFLIPHFVRNDRENCWGVFGMVEG